MLTKVKVSMFIVFLIVGLNCKSLPNKLTDEEIAKLIRDAREIDKEITKSDSFSPESIRYTCYLNNNICISCQKYDSIVHCIIEINHKRVKVSDIFYAAMEEKYNILQAEKKENSDFAEQGFCIIL